MSRENIEELMLQAYRDLNAYHGSDLNRRAVMLLDLIDDYLRLVERERRDQL